MANQTYSSIHSGAEIDEQITYVKKDLRTRLDKMDDAISKKADGTEVVQTSERNQPNGFAGLDNNGYIPESILPKAEIIGEIEDDLISVREDVSALSATTVEMGNELANNIAENEKTAKQIFTNALKGSARGEVIRIDDVSPVERNVPVKVASKNLWDNSSTTYHKGIGTWTITQTGVSFVRNGSTGGTYMFSKKFNVTKGTTITFSCSKTGDAALSLYKDKVWGNLLKRTMTNVLSYTATEDTSILPAIIIDSTHNEVVMTDIQVEIGAEPTPYTAYVDVSTVTLSARGKNLLHIPDGVQPDVQTLTQTMENGIVSLKGTVTFTTPPSRSYSPSTGEVLVNYIEATIISLANGAFKLPRGIYTFSESVNDFSCLLVGKLGTKYWDAGGAKIYHANSTFEVTNDETYGLYLWQLEVPTTGQECSIEYAVSYPQLEYGSAATSYEPSIEPVSYPVATDGTVEGVKSIYPNTTLLTDMQGVLINCEYHKDINKVIEELTNAIISLGGNI